MLNPDQVWDELNRKRTGLRENQKAGMFRRLGEFLEKEAGADEQHPAAVARESLNAGESTMALRYLEAEIEKIKTEKKTADQVALAGLDVRQNDLERWRESLDN